MNRAEKAGTAEDFSTGFADAILESIGSPALMVERSSGLVRAVNKATSATLGLSPDELADVDYRKIDPEFDIHADAQPAAYSPGTGVAAAEPEGKHSWWNRGDGSRVEIVRQVYVPDGNARFLLVKASTRPRSEVVPELPVWLGMIVEHLPDLVRYAGIEDPLKSLYINPAGLKMMGVNSVEEANRRPLAEFFGKDIEDLFSREIIPEVKRGRVWEGESTVTNVATGRSTQLTRRAYPVKNPETGRIDSLCIIGRDVSQHTAAQRQAWMLSAVIENMPASILIISPDDSLTPLYANAACLQVNDVKDLDELKQHLNHQRKHNQALMQFVEERIPAVIQGKSMVYSSTMTNRTTGAVTPVQRVMFPIYDVDGRKVEAIGSIAVDVRNITSRTRRLEGELASKAALVEAVQHMYGAEKRRADHLSTVQQISTETSTLFDTDEMLRYFARAIRTSLDYYLVLIYTADEHGKELELRAMDGEGDGPDLTGERLPVDAQSLAGWVASFGTEMELDDTGNELKHAPMEGWREARSQFLIPIMHSKKVLGVLCLQRKEPGRMDDIDKTAARILADRIAVSMENARLFQQTREHGVLAERNRLAREIHDSLAQRLSEIHWQMRALEQKLSQSKVSEEDRTAVSSVADLAQESLAEARRSVWDLTTGELERHSLSEAIEAVVYKARSSAGLKTIFDSSGFEGYFLPGAEAALLRICQEAVNNAVTHAEASELRVTLRNSPSELELIVQDNGKGFNTDNVTGPNRTNGYGLTSIRERVRLAGGTVTIKSRPGGGTTIATVIPVPAKKQPR